jgi:hypothetical protein
MDTERLRWPDPVLRVKDAMDIHAIAMSEGVTEGGYAVFRLSDGEPMSNRLFPSRAAARKEAEKKTMDHLLILEAAPDGMPYREANACLQFERTLIAAGVRTPDSLETEQNSALLSMPRTKQDRRRLAKQLVSGKPLQPEGTPYGNLPYFLRKGN